MSNESNEFTLAQVYLRCLILVVALFGITGNVFNIIIFRHKTMRSALINKFLFALSICDLSLLVSSVFLFPFPVFAEKSANYNVFNAGVYATYIFFPVAHVSQTASVYITVALSAFRYYGISQPFRAQTIYTGYRAVAILLLIFLISTMYNVPRFLEIEIAFYTIGNVSLNESEAWPALIPSRMGTSRPYVFFYKTILYIIVIFLIPFLLLVAVNSLLIRNLAKSRHTRKALTNHTRRCAEESTVDTPTKQQRKNGGVPPTLPLLHVPVETSREKADRRTTIMLIALVVIFLFCNVLPLINSIIETMHYFYNVHIGNGFSLSVDLGNLLVSVNSAINFIIYLLFCTKYRALLVKFVSCGRYKQKDNQSRRNIEMSRAFSRTPKLSQWELSSAFIMKDERSNLLSPPVKANTLVTYSRANGVAKRSLTELDLSHKLNKRHFTSQNKILQKSRSNSLTDIPCMSTSDIDSV